MEFTYFSLCFLLGSGPRQLSFIFLRRCEIMWLVLGMRCTESSVTKQEMKKEGKIGRSEERGKKKPIYQNNKKAIPWACLLLFFHSFSAYKTRRSASCIALYPIVRIYISSRLRHCRGQQEKNNKKHRYWGEEGCMMWISRPPPTTLIRQFSVWLWKVFFNFCI